MKKLFMILFVCAAFLIFISDTKAVGCSLDQRVKYNEIASKIRLSYESRDITKVDSEGLEYSVSVLDLKIYNVSDELNYKLTTGRDTADLDYSMSVNGVITVRINDVSTIKNYVLDVYPVTYDCYTEKIKSVKITLPKYNYESSSELCEGIEDYYLCQKFITTDLNEDTFYQNVQNYKTKIKSSEIEGLELESSDNDIAKKISNNKYLFLIGILIIGVVITFVVLKKKGSER